MFLFTSLLFADALDEARSDLKKGKYEECIRKCLRAIDSEKYQKEDLFLLIIRSQLILGQYEEAAKTLKTALEATDQRSIRLLSLGRRVLQFQDRLDEAEECIDKINELATSRGWAYRDPLNLIALGRTALALGEEPRWVLEFFYDPGRRADPPLREAVLAAGKLALEKEDMALAATIFRGGLKTFEDDPDLLFGLAMSFENSDPKVMGELIERALDVNPRHIPSLLKLADRAIDAEEYELSEATLKRVLEINPHQPEAWAYFAVIAHLESKPENERAALEKGTRFWKGNPAVPQLIGKKLSQKYRFKEGAAYQRKALVSKPDHSKAQLQLAQDLLRLGDEDEGWKWAARAHEEDGYNVTAYNLLALKDTLDAYETLESDSFILRLPAKEAAIFGDQVMELLEEARAVLCDKYRTQLERRIVVELFDHQKDFAVRTFGMPHNPGFLGVCFGNVITANSPSSQSNPSNWRAVLWHEFCHVITLTITKNKMPRWLSEGISVFEEIQRDPSWGQSFNPKYRGRVLNNLMTPVSDLSAAFMNARSNEDVQFAYFQSCLVVKFLVEEYGLNALISILQELGKGIPINDALSNHTISIDELDDAFEEYAEKAAMNFGMGLNWDVPEDSISAVSSEMALALNPQNYYLLLAHSRALIKDEKWREAIAILGRILEPFPIQPGNEDAPRLLARCYQALGQTEKERDILEEIARTDHEAPEIYLRLIELDFQQRQWETIEENIERLLAVSPFFSHPYHYLAKVKEALGDGKAAIDAYEILLHLDPTDPADIHFQLARLLFEKGDLQSRKHIIMALEEAPRYRDAYRLLRKINEKSSTHFSESIQTIEKIETSDSDSEIDDHDDHNEIDDHDDHDDHDELDDSLEAELQIDSAQP